MVSCNINVIVWSMCEHNTLFTNKLHTFTSLHSTAQKDAKLKNSETKLENFMIPCEC